MSMQTDTGINWIGLAARIAGVALLAAASLAAIADQSGRFVGVHEVPPFVCDRVEIVQVEVSFPGSPVCARRPGD